ncbi:hypothetical protein JT358_05325 [Micrococcales bacterium 31B]|nr:hypothetical protein [Micrococcales bacterium 31B]
MSWFDRMRQQGPSGPVPLQNGAQQFGAPPPGAQIIRDDIIQLVFEMVLKINRYGGKIPTDAAVLSRLITDAILIVARREQQFGETIDIDSKVLFRGILTDYLPNTLSTYARSVTGGPNEEFRRSLIEQLHLMLDRTQQIVRSAQENDTRALRSHQQFMETRFHETDLRF